MITFEPDGVCAGIPYRVLPDNSIEAMMPGGLVKFKNLDQLLSALPPLSYEESPYTSGALGQAIVHNGHLPARPADYYSLLLDAIKRAKTDSAQLRSLVYERARFNFKRDILFGHSSLGLADLVRHVNDFELAVARIEATAELGDQPPASLEQRRGAETIHEPELSFSLQRKDPPRHASDENDLSDAQPPPFSPPESIVEVLPPRRMAPFYDWLAPIRSRDFSYEQESPLSFKRIAQEKYSLITFAVLLVGSVFALTLLLRPPPPSPTQTSTAAAVPQAPSPVPAAIATKPPEPTTPAKAAAKTEFPLPTSFGVYALNDDKLTELETLPISVPDARVALSAEINDPSKKVISSNRPSFILFRREFRNNVPQKISLRVVARLTREIKIVDGKATTKQIEGPWRIRNISRDLTVAPVPGEPEMLVARLDEGVTLPSGRYALVVNRSGYDVSIGGPVTSKDFCLEGFETVNGNIFTPCRSELAPKNASRRPRQNADGATEH